MSLDWRGAFYPGLKCVENMGCHGILVSTLDSQMYGVVLWWFFFLETNTNLPAFTLGNDG